MAEDEIYTNKRVLSGLKRLIHAKIFKSKQVASLKPIERLLYIGMVVFSDDNGRFIADDKILKADVFALENISTKKVKKMKENVKNVGLIEIYEKNNEEYGYHPNWLDYQMVRKDRLKVGKIPSPPESGETIRQPSDNQVTAQTNINELKLNKNNINEETTSFKYILKNSFDSSSSSYKGKFKTNAYYPQNYEEGQALTMAKWLGEEYFDYLLGGLQKYGISSLLEAFEITKKKVNEGGVDNKRKYFNGTLNNIVDPKYRVDIID